MKTYLSFKTKFKDYPALKLPHETLINCYFLICVHLVPFKNLSAFYLEVIVNWYAVVRNYGKMLSTFYPISNDKNLIKFYTVQYQNQDIAIDTMH